MILSKPTTIIEVEENLGVKARAEADHPVLSITVSTVGRATIGVIVLHLVKNVGNVEKKTTLRLFASWAQIEEIAANIGQKVKGKKKFHEINEEEGVMDDLTKQVQSLFYNEVHFNAMNARMHTTLSCVTPDGRSSDQVFKIDTGADGNLMPIRMFAVLFPKVSLDALSRQSTKK